MEKNKVLSVNDTRKMSKEKIQLTLGQYTKELEKLGMDHESACGFVSSIMNLGIAAHERWNEKHPKSVES